MAGKQTIDELISDKAFQQVDVLNAKLTSLNSTFDTSIDNARRYSDTLAGARGMREINNNSTQAQIAVERLNRSIAQTAIVNQRLQQATLRTATQQANANRVTATANGEYARLVASYNAATLAARNAGVQFGTQSQQFIQAGARVQNLRGQLDAIDQPLGNFQRNVGNYASGIAAFGQKAFNSIRTIANILPGLGLSGAFLLIFEGLKFLVEQFNIFDKGVSSAKLTLDAFKSALSDGGEYTKAVKNVSELRENIKLAKDGFIDKTSVVKQYNDTIGKTTGEVSNLDEAEKQLNKNAKDYIKFTFLKATANAALEASSKKATEAQLQAVQDGFDGAGFGDKAKAFLKGLNPLSLFGGTDLGSIFLKSEELKKKRVASTQKESDDLLNIFNKFQAQAAALSKKDGFDFFGGKEDGKDNRKQILDQRLKDAKLSEEAILQNEQISYDDRILAIADYENTVSNLLAKARKDKVITALEESNYFKELDVKTAKERKEITEKLQKEIVKAFDGGIKNANTALQQEIIDLREAQDTKLLEIEKYQSEAMQITAQQYSEGKITAAEYNQQIYDIEKQSAKDRIDLQIQTLEKILATQQDNLSFGIGDPKDIQRTQNLITKLRIDSSNLETKVILDNVEKVKTARNQLHDLEKRIADESIELIQTLVDGSYQRQLDALSDQSDQLTKNGDTEKEAVDRSLATDEEKANKKKIIDAKVQSQQEVIAQREREVKTRQAKFDKAISIARIIEATGIAEVQALTYLSNPFTAPLYPAIAAAIATLGAIQLATVIATPIPKYAKGTDYHKGGAMIVGDAGTELVIEPNGRQYLTPDTDTLTSAPKGTKVLPNHEVIRMLAKPEKINYVGGQSVDIAQLVAAQNKTTKAIQGQKMAGTLFTKGGMKRANLDITNWQAYKKQHFN